MQRTETTCGPDSDYAAVQALLNGMGMHQSMRKGFQSPTVYLGVILDRKLNWAEHLELQCARFIATFQLCRRACGRTWGLGPRMIAWLYSVILKARLLYAAVAWWPWILLKTVQAKMSRLQTLTFRGITGTMRSTLMAAVGFIVCKERIHIATITEAAQTMGRLTAMGKWMRGK